MTPAQLDALQSAAMARIRERINRSAGQHLLAIRRAAARIAMP